MIERGWDKIYILVDIHDTIIRSDYTSENRTYDYYPDAIPCLNYLSNLDDVYLILWSSCKTRVAADYISEFGKKGIFFDDFNMNSDVKNTEYAYFALKPYFNVIIDDKAGFEAEKDWTEFLTFLKEI